MSKHLLITNDDGIESAFLHTLAKALAAHFRITVAAPSKEQSWIGRAVSRRRPVKVEPFTQLPWAAWTIDGTPTDCVNIALGNLLKSPPDAVVSGINIGCNTTVPLIYSSGTVAGALEGAFWGLPAFAVSQEIPDELFGKVSQAKGHLPAQWQQVLSDNAAHAAGLIERILHGTQSVPDPPRSGDAIVHNLNYPCRPLKPYETVITVPAPLQELPLYIKSETESFTFHFRHGIPLHSHEKTDQQAIAAGEVSHSILNFSALGRDLNH